MIEVKITAETAEEYTSALKVLFSAAGIAAVNSAPESPFIEAAPAAGDKPVTKSRAGAGKKADTAAATTNAVTGDKSEYTLDDIRELITQSEQPEKTREMLLSYKDVEDKPVTRLTLLQKKDYTAYAGGIKLLISGAGAAAAEENFLD